VLFPGASAAGARLPQIMNKIDRRAFLKLSSASFAALALPSPRAAVGSVSFPDGERLCRVTEPHAELFSRPTPDSKVMGEKEFDDVLVVYRDVIGKGIYPRNHVWFETPEGFIWSARAQPVRNQPNDLLVSIPEEGIWTEVTVPYVEGRWKPDSRSDTRYRLYYSMVLNVEARELGPEGGTWYRVHDENGVVMYAHGESFRLIQPEELDPISPEIEDKSIVVNLSRQDLSVRESGVEVYYCRISSGYSYYPSDGIIRWYTPVGNMWIWRKMVSRHFSGGDAVSGFDLPGTGWTMLFHGGGAALHSTYWHNDFGTPRSAGCINMRPEDAKWVFRWTLPRIEYRPGDLTVQWPNPGTRVIVEA